MCWTLPGFNLHPWGSASTLIPLYYAASRKYFVMQLFWAKLLNIQQLLKYLPKFYTIPTKTNTPSPSKWQPQHSRNSRLTKERLVVFLLFSRHVKCIDAIAGERPGSCGTQAILWPHRLAKTHYKTQNQTHPSGGWQLLRLLDDKSGIHQVSTSN